MRLTNWHPTLALLVAIIVGCGVGDESSDATSNESEGYPAGHRVSRPRSADAAPEDNDALGPSYADGSVKADAASSSPPAHPPASDAASGDRNAADAASDQAVVDSSVTDSRIVDVVVVDRPVEDACPPYSIIAGSGAKTAYGIPLPGPAPTECSTSANTASRLTIINRACVPVEIWWVNYECAEISYGLIKPGGQWVVNTYVTHPWRIRAAPGQSLLRNIAPNRDGNERTVAFP